MRFFEQTTVFNYSWDQVARGFWNRYPNPNSKHVLTEDTVKREVRSGQLFSVRILSKTNSIPKWAERFVRSNLCHIVEESVVDPDKRTLTTYTRNLGFAKVMSVVEKVVYTECEEHPKRTIVLRTAWIDSQVRGFSRAICAFGHERFKKNCTKAATGFNYVLMNMFPLQNNISTTHSTVTAASKLKDAAKNASELAKAKAAPIYATLHPHNS